MIAVTVELVTDLLIPAVSFPTLSKRISFLRIPRIIFFIGKHFGTGLSTIQKASTRIRLMSRNKASSYPQHLYTCYRTHSTLSKAHRCWLAGE